MQRYARQLRYTLKWTAAGILGTAGLQEGTAQTFTKIENTTSPFINRESLVNVEIQNGKSAFSDLDGDGNMDMVMSGYYGDYFFFKNSGTTTNPVFDAPVNADMFGLTDIGSGSAPIFY